MATVGRRTFSRDAALKKKAQSAEVRSYRLLYIIILWSHNWFFIVLWKKQKNNKNSNNLLTYNYNYMHLIYI